MSLPSALLLEPALQPPTIRERLRRRTRELAVRAGRSPQQISQLDYEQAKRELTGESDAGRQDSVLLALDSPPAGA
jgi:hypothetical protein